LGGFSVPHVPFHLPFDLWLLAPIGYVLVGWFAGVVLEHILIARLRKLAERTEWEGDDVVLDAFDGLTKWVGALLGLHLSVFGGAFSAGLSSWIQKGTIFAAVFVATVYASRVAVGFVHLYTRSVEGVVPSMSIFHSITKIAVYVLGVLIALQSVGISIAPILTALGVGGLATALALQPTLANLFSGIQILASRSINPGNYIRLDGGEEGYVVDINWRTATIRSLTNSLILVPNSRLANAVVTNHHFPDHEVAFSIAGSVAYGSDLEHVERVVADVGQDVQTTVAGAVSAFRPAVRFTGFADSGISFAVGLRAAEYADQFLLKHEFLKRLESRFRAEGIEMPYPHLVVQRPE
jgi:small-conductance mechanosensitive channel